MEAVYRLHKSPASFNFVEFLVAAKTLGATSIVLDDTLGYRKKFDAMETSRRMASIVEPACALAGMPFRYGLSGHDAIDPGYGLRAPLRAWKAKGHICKLQSVLEPIQNEYTVTIRHSRHQDGMNTPDFWRQFSCEIGAVLIDDYEDQPIPLHKRMALYAGSKMNFFGPNGPACLCYFSDYPYTAVWPRILDNVLDGALCPNGQFPWANANQRIVITQIEPTLLHEWWPPIEKVAA